jgi:hypothetical protein
LAGAFPNAQFQQAQTHHVLSGRPFCKLVSAQGVVWYVSPLFKASHHAVLRTECPQDEEKPSLMVAERMMAMESAWGCCLKYINYDKRFIQIGLWEQEPIRSPALF